MPGGDVSYHHPGGSDFLYQLPPQKERTIHRCLAGAGPEVGCSAVFSKGDTVIVTVTSEAEYELTSLTYTPEGGTVSLYVFSEGDYVRIEVIDNGIGIPADQIDKIFERFYRVDKARSRKENRYGLGLAIAKNIVANYNGNITANSNNRKTTFRIVL